MKITLLFALAPLVLLLGCSQKAKPDESKSEPTNAIVFSDGKNTVMMAGPGKVIGTNGEVVGEVEASEVRIGTNILKRVEGPKH